jgi:hypothetical protein
VSWVVPDNGRLNLGCLRRDEHIGVERGGACDERGLQEILSRLFVARIRRNTHLLVRQTSFTSWMV